ncbi:hypothetical protein HJ588_16910 [Flexivirga sp. ID2601S]|uniref:Uncharacterized protein n=1 Tax=Flexivirga aerilata TaxID=1656889 RepID=A0A849ANG6_9MICO|nr:hypothetical protein [Flexivirga aerilata]NNG40941.1 hypothetical protein [Flexivirga aerilata]
MSSLARELIDADEVDAFDAEIRRLAEPLAEDDGLLTLQLTSTVVWGELTRIS